MRFLFVLLIVLPFKLLAQDQNVQSVEATDADWGDGSILLNSGSELKGLVRYNDRTGVVAYESGTTSKSFTARTITGFEFFDHVQSRQRFFYSLLYQDGNDMEAKVFFEVLRQYKEFAIIGKTDPIDVKKRDASKTYNAFNGTTMSKNAKITVTQTHTLYFLGDENKIQPYLQVIHKMVDKVMFDRDRYKNKILDKEILEQQLGGKLSAVEKYAKEQKLELDEEEDFLKIMDYWDRDLRN